MNTTNKKFFSLTLSVLLTLGLYSSCNNEDFFQLTNPPEFPWLNMNELEFGIVAPYSAGLHSSWGGAFYMVGNVIMDIMSDQVYLVPGSAANYPFIETYFRTVDVQISRADDVFNAAYMAIGGCNSVLDFLNATDREPYQGMNANDRLNIDRIEGEALFFRSYAYFYLLMMHAPSPGSDGFTSREVLPLRLNFPTSASEAIDVEFATASRLYDIIIDDLKKSIELLPEQFQAGIHHPSYQHGRANRYAAAMILNRVYFRLGRIDEALPLLDYVISGPYHLDQDPIEAFNRSNATKGNEVIWYAQNYDDVKRFTPRDATLYNFTDYRAMNGGRGADVKRGGWHQFTMSHYALQRIGWMDNNFNETNEARSDKRYQQLYYRLEPKPNTPDPDPNRYELQYPQITTPMVWGDKYYRGMDGQFSNVPLVRLAEAHLTRAIIRHKKGNVQGATADVNVVRRRAGLPELATVTAEDIHRERIKEMSFEGDRMNYLQSLQLPIGPANRENVQPIEAPYNGLFWRIPQREMDFRNQRGD
jgi:starch-binding outer membrane protein, SusD/RagB family